MSDNYNEYRELLKKGRYIEASRLAEKGYHEGNMNNPFWLTRQAAALSRAGKDKDALNVAKQALSLDHSNPYSILAVAYAFLGLNRIDEAIGYYEEIIDNQKVAASARRGILRCKSLKKEWDQLIQLPEKWGMAQSACLQ